MCQGSLKYKEIQPTRQTRKPQGKTAKHITTSLLVKNINLNYYASTTSTSTTNLKVSYSNVTKSNISNNQPFPNTAIMFREGKRIQTPLWALYEYDIICTSIIIIIVIYLKLITCVIDA